MRLAAVPFMAAAAAAAAPGLGPGRKEWQIDTPENHGLDSAKLSAAANLTAKVAPERYCLVVIKDGYLIHESYFGNSSEALYETDSLGKTTTAALFGVAVEEGLIDIDKPVIEYNVSREQADWNATGYDYYPQLTVRHSSSPGRGRCVSTVRDNNRRRTGKSQSKQQVAGRNGRRTQVRDRGTAVAVDIQRQA